MAVAEALRIAQMNIRVEYPHPYYWAAFVVTRDGDHVTQASFAPAKLINRDVLREE